MLTVVLPLAVPSAPWCCSCCCWWPWQNGGGDGACVCVCACGVCTGSQYFYALLQYYGEGVSQDRNTAARYFRKAAMQGHKEAATNLGVMHYSGEGAS